METLTRVETAGRRAERVFWIRSPESNWMALAPLTDWTFHRRISQSWNWFKKKKKKKACSIFTNLVSKGTLSTDSGDIPTTFRPTQVTNIPRLCLDAMLNHHSVCLTILRGWPLLWLLVWKPVLRCHVLFLFCFLGGVIFKQESRFNCQTALADNYRSPGECG